MLFAANLRFGFPALILGLVLFPLALPAPLRGVPELASGPAFATANGLLSWAAGYGRSFTDVDLEPPQPVGLLRRLVNFLKERV